LPSKIQSGSVLKLEKCANFENGEEMAMEMFSTFSQISIFGA